MARTPSPSTISTKLQRIANLAREAPQLAFTTLAHHIDINLLREAYHRTRKDAAVGIDGQTAAEYAKDLEVNLRALLDRVKSGKYQGRLPRRVRLPTDASGRPNPMSTVSMMSPPTRRVSAGHHGPHEGRLRLATPPTLVPTEKSSPVVGLRWVG
jgi:hypothetical protein